MPRTPLPDPDCTAPDDAEWAKLLTRDPALADPNRLYRKLLAPGPLILGRIAQTLDGRIATASGESFWISGPEDILHTHRLRALFDAVVVGAGTVRADDPLLTTRNCPGPSPVRVVIDTDRRLGDAYRLFAAAPRTVVVCANDVPPKPSPRMADIMLVPRVLGGLDLAAVIAGLQARGLARIFIEGGGLTVSRFLAAGLLDRLHVTIAPLLLGAGIPAFTLPGVSHPDQGLRVGWTVHRLGQDLLLDIPLART
jgi:diaminohydroxyphosphoribosylaminopyrimidine deaminase/5-amino-6-(5-phosphoribosylamino)uracil reductase